MTGNIFQFRRATLRTAVNVGADTAPATFRFTHDLFYEVDDPARSVPDLPVVPVNAIIGAQPMLGADDRPLAGSPVIGAGDPAVSDRLDADFGGGCFADPPSVGAYEPAGP